MKTIIKILLLMLCLGVYQPVATSAYAQNDKAQQYLRDAQRYNEEAEKYEREAQQLTEKANNYTRQAEKYAQKKDYNQSRL